MRFALGLAPNAAVNAIAAILILGAFLTLPFTPKSKPVAAE